MKIASTILLLCAMTLSTPIVLDNDKLETTDFSSVVEQEEYAMFLVYNSEQTPNYEDCIKTLTDLDRNYLDNITFYQADLTKSKKLFEFFGFEKDTQEESGYQRLEICSWSLNVHGISVPYHNENSDFESISFWLDVRMKNQPKSIDSSNQFYKITSAYFAGIYGYIPKKDETQEQVEKTQKKNPK